MSTTSAPASQPGEPAGATAPGKVMLAGEYAVLEGATAVLVTIDRRVIARVGDAPAARSPVLAAVRDRIAASAGPDSAAARAAARIACDSSALRDAGGIKLGLGSSAAVAVAATARALAADTPAAPALVHELAHLAHGDAQQRRGARGSGADVAACCYGGAVAVTPRVSDRDPPRVSRLGAVPVTLAFAWTGRAADTVALIGRVEAYRLGSPRAHAARIAEIAGAAEALAAAVDAADTAGALAAIAAGGVAVAALGRDAEVPLETEAHRALAALAARHGGAVKPTGAGGGDVALAAFAAPEPAAAFRAEAAAAAIPVLALALDPDGVRLTFSS